MMVHLNKGEFQPLEGYTALIITYKREQSVRDLLQILIDLPSLKAVSALKYLFKCKLVMPTPDNRLLHDVVGCHCME